MEQDISRPTSAMTHQFASQAPLELTATSRTMASSPTLAANEAVARRRAEGKETLHLGI